MTEKNENKPENEEDNHNSKDIFQTEISGEMKKSYLDYAMSVIVARALPAIEDGLKPVQRRILYSMHQMGLKPNTQTKKSARIVGECMGKYHPHGDMAIYDALVRMAQDFSLRYPLVFGQGNWGCFTADTKVALADGRSISFAELIKEQQQGKRNFAFTIDNREIKIAEIENPRLTKENAEIMKVVLDNGEEIRCTLNHKFMLRDGNYKEAKDLISGDSLMPIYSRLSEREDRINREGYLLIYQPKNDEWVLAHNLADNYNLMHKVYFKNAGRVRHHVDFNKLNNNPSNIRKIGWGEHWKIHYDHAKELHKNSIYREKIALGRKKFWDKEENREISAKRLSERNKINWQNEDYRQKMKKTLSEVNKRYMEAHPEIRKEIGERLSKTLKRLWQDKSYREKKINSLKENWKDPDYYKKQSEKMKQLSQKIWSNPEHKSFISEVTKKRMQNPSVRYKVANFYKEKFNNDEEFREYFLKIISNNGKNANYYRFLTVCKRAIKEYGLVTAENYEQVRIKYNDRKGAGIIKFNSGFNKFFNGDIENLNYNLGRIPTTLNHKVKDVVFLKEYADVYDLTIDKTHNFALASGVFVHNSIDGDPAAAQRYTEAKLMPISSELLQDIDKEAVKFLPNYDNSLKEPELLPGKLPALLLNGASGIAVGMATNIPPHNLVESCDAITAYIKNPDITTEKLIEIITGPDFPTGGYVSGDMLELYKTGKGKLLIRGKTTTENIRSKETIVITEIPYMVNKSDLVIKIAEMIQNKKIRDVSDLRDESSKGKIRIVLELRKGANQKFVTNTLYKYTRLQDTFGVNFLALVKGQPRVLNLKQILQEYVEYRKKIIANRTKFELNKATERLEIVEGLLIALKNIDEVVISIKKSNNVTEALETLVKKFSLTKKQAQAVLDTKLQQLTSLEQDKLKKENEELKNTIAELKKILGDIKEILKVIVKEVGELKRNYGDSRRTYVLQRVAEISEKDLVQKKEVVITITEKGYCKRMDVKSYKEQRRGGKGVIGSNLATGDFVRQLITCSTYDYLMFFTSGGKVLWLKAYDIPEAERYSKGKSLANLLNLKDEKITSVISMSKFEDSLFMATKNGMVKKISLSYFSKPRASGVRAINLPADNSDVLIDVQVVQRQELRKLTLATLSKSFASSLVSQKGKSQSKGQEVLLATKKGQAIRFSSDDVREMGRASYGVTGIKLDKGDEVVSLEILNTQEVLTITKNGYGKRTSVKDYRKTARAGKGVRNLKVTEKTGDIVTTVSVNPSNSIIITTAKGMVIRTSLKNIRVMGRATQGVRIVKLQSGDSVTDLIRFQEADEGNGEE